MCDINSDRLSRLLIRFERQYHKLLPPLCSKIWPAGHRWLKHVVIATARVQYSATVSSRIKKCVIGRFPETERLTTTSAPAKRFWKSCECSVSILVWGNGLVKGVVHFFKKTFADNLLTPMSSKISMSFFLHSKRN